MDESLSQRSIIALLVIDVVALCRLRIARNLSQHNPEQGIQKIMLRYQLINVESVK